LFVKAARIGQAANYRAEIEPGLIQARVHGIDLQHIRVTAVIIDDGFAFSVQAEGLPTYEEHRAILILLDSRTHKS